MNPRSSPLADTLADTLERANAQLDPAVVERLAQLRQQALQTAASPLPSGVGTVRLKTSVFPPHYQWAAMAAMVALCALMLGVTHSLLPQRSPTGLLASGSPTAITPEANPLPTDAWAEDPQMLADWEMLDALGEEPDAG